MFLLLIGVTFILSLLVCLVVARLFAKPIDAILAKIVADDVAFAWSYYLKFAIYVTGVSGGASVYYLENFLRAPTDEFIPPDLTLDRWVLEVFRAIIGSLQSIAWMLLVFFVFALIAYVIVRVFELRSKS